MRRSFVAVAMLLVACAPVPNADNVETESDCGPEGCFTEEAESASVAPRALYRVASFAVASDPPGRIRLENPPIVMRLNPPMEEATAYVAGDSLRVVVTWRQPTDGIGNADSTTFRVRANRTIRFPGGGTVAPETWRRRKHTTALSDTFKFALPAVRDSIIFTADSIQQWRQGDGSVPGGWAGSYVRSAAPPSMTFSTTSREVF